MSVHAPSYILELAPYIPGKSIKDAQKEYGVADFIKLASNENPYGCSPYVREAITDTLSDIHFYPNSEMMELKERICERHNDVMLSPQHIAFGNGSNELIHLLVRALVCKHEKVAYTWPSFVSYRIAAQSHGHKDCAIPLNDDLSFDVPAILNVCNQESENPVKMLFLGNPNNPTGTYLKAHDFKMLLNELSPHVVLVIDEAYEEYVDEADYIHAVPEVLARPRTVVLRTFSKIFGLAGLRIGYAIAEPEMIELINRVRDPFSVNMIAQAAAFAALNDVEHVQKSKLLNAECMGLMEQGFEHLNLAYTKSIGNFVLMHLPEKYSAPIVTTQLFRKGIIVRPVANYDLQHMLRVTVGTKEQTERFLGALSEVL